MAEHTGRLHFDRCDLLQCLHVNVMLYELRLDLLVLGENDHLYDHVRLLVGTEATIQRIQFAGCDEALLQQPADDVERLCPLERTLTDRISLLTMRHLVLELDQMTWHGVHLGHQLQSVIGLHNHLVQSVRELLHLFGIETNR